MKNHSRGAVPDRQYGFGKILPQAIDGMPVIALRKRIESRQPHRFALVRQCDLNQRIFGDLIGIARQRTRRYRPHPRGIMATNLPVSYISQSAEGNESNPLLKAQLHKLLRILQAVQLAFDQTLVALPVAHQNGIVDLVGTLVFEQMEGMRGSQSYGYFRIMERGSQLGNRTVGREFPESGGGGGADMAITVVERPLGECNRFSIVAHERKRAHGVDPPPWLIAREPLVQYRPGLIGKAGRGGFLF